MQILETKDHLNDIVKKSMEDFDRTIDNLVSSDRIKELISKSEYNIKFEEELLDEKEE